MANGIKFNKLHNHEPPAKWKILPNVVRDITNTVARNSNIAPKEVQKGLGMNYQPMAVSNATAHIDRIRAVVKKAKKMLKKLTMIASIPLQSSALFHPSKSELIVIHNW